ncbi:transporter [Lactiplantibacillus garii]|uniref:Transporter n=1 Tax=Lactiplantibacillus garii TaxID=2306423 RepID=A0A426DA58_9LACO|nr:MMPL family transporter [Lactiplantibacillus garii]RRK11477.1 transporter [Lactiplantibacillus garii]
MRKLLKAKFLFVFFWIIVVFASIAILPNLESLLTRQESQATQSTVVNKQQQRWGHGLNGTQSLTLVFNNPGGKLTSYQKYQVHRVLNNLNLKADDYGIKQLRTSEMMTNDKQLLTASDGSTEIALAAVKTSTANLPIIANQINNAIAVSGINTAVTSPQLVSRQHTEQRVRQVISAYLIGSAVMLLILGFIFRSLLVPLINLLTQVIVLITSTSIIANAQTTWRLPFTVNTVVLIGLLSLLVTTLLTWSFMHDYWAENVLNTESDQVSLATLTIQYKRWLIVLLPLILLALVLERTQLMSLASAWTLAVVLVITTLATPTLNYAFTALLGESIYWPGTRAWRPRPKNLWGQFARLSHWQPILGCLAAALLVLPGLLSAKAQFADDNLHPARQAELTAAEFGQQMLTAHFGNGAADPIVVTIHNTKPVTTQAGLQALDAVTTKLQVIKNVNRVVSVTQPTGHRLSPFYVKNQISLINADLAGKQVTVTGLQKRLNTAQLNLQQAATARHAKSVDRLSGHLNKLATANDDLLDQLSTLNDTLAEPATVKGHTGRINRQFSQLDRLNDRMTTLLNDLVDDQNTVAEQAGKTDRKVHKVRQSLKKTTQALQSLLASLKVTSTYLTGLANSQIGESFYLPANGHLNSSYQNSLFTNVSSDQLTTQLTITLNSSPTSATSFKTFHTVQRVVNDGLAATPLSHAQVTTSGVTSQQAARHQLIATHGIKWALLGLGILAVCLWLALSSFTLSVILTTGLAGLSLASWGWTQLLLTHWFKNGPLSSAVFLWGVGLLSFHWLAVTLITVNRRRWLRQFNDTKLLRHFYLAGQSVWPLTLFELTYLLPLLLMSDSNLRALAVMGLVGIGLSNLCVPLTLPGLITWAVRPPKFPKKWLAKFRLTPKNQ